MEEKERYEQYGYGTIVDNEVDLEDYEHSRLYMSDVINLLNQQDKEIQQLKQQLKDTEESYNNTMRYLNKTRSELLNLPKKIVEYFYDEIRHRAILEDDYCPDHNLERKYGVRKCLLEDIRTTILKKYGDKNESNND